MRIDIPHWLPRPTPYPGDIQMIALCAHRAGIPRASGKRAVSVSLAGRNAPDGEAMQRVVINALVACGLLKNDSPDWCERTPIQFQRAESKACTIILEDLPGGV